MLYFVIGLPGRFAEWCEALVARLAHEAEGADAVLTADTLDGLAAAALATGISHGIVSCRRPGGRLRDTLVEAGRRFVVALDDPRHALVDLAGGDAAAVADATPIIASSCAALAGYDRAPGAGLVRAAEAAADPVAAAAAIADHLELAVDPARIAEIVGMLAQEGLRADTAAAARWQALDPNPRAWAEGALGGYIAYFDTGALAPLSWARELFFLGDRPEERAAWIIDITGRARCLLQGPGIMVAPGHWQMAVKLLFSREATENEFLVELLADRQLAAVTVKPEREGGLELNFPLSLDAAANHPLTIRVSNRRAAFDGACAMDMVILTPQNAP